MTAFIGDVRYVTHNARGEPVADSGATSPHLWVGTGVEVEGVEDVRVDTTAAPVVRLGYWSHQAGGGEPDPGPVKANRAARRAEANRRCACGRKVKNCRCGR